MQLLLNAAIAGSFLALIATGLSLVYGVLRIFNMALGQFALVAAYVTWWCMDSWQLSLLPSAVLGLFIGIVISWLSFELFIEPFYRRHRFLPIATTIALSMILDGLLILCFDEQPRSIVSGIGGSLHLGSAILSVQQLVLILVTVLFLLFVAWMLNSTRIGRAIRATVEHPHAAESLGISTFTLHRVLFIVSGFLAGLAGIYQAMDQNITPVLGFTITIKAYAALIMGGMGSIRGTILCAYLIALLEQLAVGVPFFGTYIPAGYQGAVALLVIILMLLVRPQGIFGQLLRRA